MRGWEVLILPLLGFTVWLISNLMRIMEENKPKKKGEASLIPGESEPMTDMDRFLLQARQKRTQGQPKARSRPELDFGTSEQPTVMDEPIVNRRLLKDQDPADRPVVLMELVPDQVPEPPPPRVTPSTPPQRKRRKESGSSQTAMATPPMAAIPAPIQDGDLPEIPFKNRPSILKSPSSRPVSPVLSQVISLLRSPQSAATAVVLREILDRPPSTRRRPHSF